ncbi:helix-turn-helix transcriptional regulator [Ornithinimicrobium tianjinense]|uniref:Transcriptional regulator n=1 Tax=Ornithinimicrobium tianjinense TaxID=1195761 RepID=A0A917F039_9MICO|nr:helix-turn-helix transcriptional regulator [Ornithinimicrobium tianjinense]GGF37186.1 transcriptional regulator [Ornithinimicrobium tianjinense]
MTRTTARRGGTRAPAPARLHGEAYEESVSRLWLTAVRLGRPTLDALRKQGWDDAEIEDITAELTARGMLVPNVEGDAWQVVPPAEAVLRHIERWERRISLARATASELDQIWRAAVGDGRELQPAGMELLKSVADIAQRVRGMHRLATERLWWALDASAASLALLEESATEEGVLPVRSGVDVRIVVDTALLDTPHAMSFVERAQAAGHPVRVAAGLPFSLLLCDARAAILDLSRHDPVGDGSLEARRTGPLKGVEALLQEIWVLSTPLAVVVDTGTGTVLDGVPLDDRDRRVLALLATGASDQLIARQSGISVRTVERRVRYLMDHLGAATRFQAGVQAARRGWL